MSDQTKPAPEVVFSMEVDSYFEFIDPAVVLASAGSRPVARLPANAPILTVDAEEMTEFIQKAISAGNPPSGSGDQKRESA